MVFKPGITPAHDIKRTNLERGIPADIQTTDDYIEFSFSSEYPVERREWGYTESLSHSLGSVDLSRVNMGAAPLLWNHDRDQVIGKIERAWVDSATRRGRCKARWGSSDLAEQIRKDVRLGIISNVSVQYDIQGHSGVGHDGVVTVDSWSVNEISIVSIPADPSVGIGRSNSTINKGERTMTSATERERDRVLKIEALRRNFADRDPKVDEICDEALEDGYSADTARAKISDQLLGDPRPPIQGYHGGAQRDYGGGLVLGSRDADRFSLRDVIAGQLDPATSGSFAREIHQELHGKGFRAQNGGLLVPLGMLAAKRAPQLTTTPAVSGLVPDNYMPGLFIDALREDSVAARLGVRFENMPPGTATIPKQTGITTAQFVGENIDLPEVAPTFTTIDLAPKQLGCWTSFSRLTMSQTVPGFDSLLAADFGRALGEGLDNAILNGNGTGPNPRGLLQTPGVNTVSLGTNGGALTYERLVAMETPLNVQNVPRSGRGYLVPSRVENSLKTTLKFGAGTEATVWEPSPKMEGGMGMVNGYVATSTNYLPTNLTKGTGTNLAALIFGHWADIWVGSWDVIEIVANPYGSGFRKGEIEMRAFWTVDICVRRPESFTTITDAAA
jgi:HK97 family phage major capsid protein/HK97 family phage prohead protease